MQRKVAIKVIKPGMDTKEVIARFEAERQALAFMEHPNIARVLDAGATESGRSYFVMELVRGIPITEYCDQVKATPQERLELFKTVCDAVQHAHQKGIIHRDIKPSNVLVTQVSAKPVVKVIDFGLAKATSGQKLTEKTVYTGFMKLIGTPVYMSPEQAGLSGLDVDTRSDVYSLGNLLYELLTGTTPLDKTEIQKQAYDELCRKIREVEAPKPSSRISTLKDADRSTIAQQRGVEPKNLRQMLDGDLDIVVLKALEKDRDRRYATPQDLAADVDRFLADQPVLAVPASQLYLARKYMRRHRTAIFTAATILVVLLAATAISTWQAVRATRFATDANVQRDEAKVQRKVAEDQRRLAVAAKDQAKRTAEERRRLLYAADMALAAQLWESPNGDLKRINELLSKWIPSDESPADWRDFSWRFLWTQLHQGATVTILKTSGSTVSNSGNLITADKDGIHQWNETGTESDTKWTGDASQVVFSPDRRWAAITMEDITRLVEIETGRMVLELPYKLCSFSTGGKRIVGWKAGTQSCQVWKLSNADAELVEPVAVPENVQLPASANSLQLHDDGHSFLLARHPGRAAVTAYLSGQLGGPPPDPIIWEHRNGVHGCAWSPNGQVMASGSSSGMVHLRWRERPLAKFVISSHGKGIHKLLFSPDGNRLAVGGSDGTFDLWDTSELRELSNVDPSADNASDGQSEPSKDTGSQGRLPHAARPILIGTTKAHLGESIQSLVFSADGSRLATFADGVSKLWNLGVIKGRYEVADFGEDLFGGR